MGIKFLLLLLLLLPPPKGLGKRIALVEFGVLGLVPWFSFGVEFLVVVVVIVFFYTKRCPSFKIKLYLFF
jgi:hypothetical protein